MGLHIKHSDRDECLPYLHSFVPIVENDKLVGIKRLNCPVAVYEEPSKSGITVGEKGLDDFCERI
jgi:hypothetical protein